MKFVEKKDKYIIMFILVISLSAWLVYTQFFKEKGNIAEVYYYGKLTKTIELSKGKDYSFSIPENNHITIHQYKDGSIAFTKSNCPDKICINTGKIHSIGQSAACLPNGIIIKIVRDGKTQDKDADVIIGT